MRRSASLVSVALLGLALSAPALAASAYLEQVAHQSGMMGQGSTTSTQKIWIADDKMRHEDSESGMAMIVRLDQKRAFLVNNKDKSYADVSLDEMAKMAESGMAMMKQLGGQGEMKFDVKNTDETMKVGQWDAYAVLLEISGPIRSTTKMWLSKDIQLDLQSWLETAKYLQMQSVLGETMEKMKGFEGYPVKQETTTEVMGMKITSSTELKLFKPGPVDAALFDPPAGYKRTEGLPGMMGAGMKGAQR